VVCRHDSDTFVELLDVIDTVYPPGRGHIIMDNLSAHDTPDVNEWFDEHPRWTRHFTPKHASWLNQIECWFSIIGRQLLARGSFTSQADLAGRRSTPTLRGTCRETGLSTCPIAPSHGRNLANLLPTGARDARRRSRQRIALTLTWSSSWSWSWTLT
jgi:hypothetical protein